jgi:hypothetical protein
MIAEVGLARTEGVRLLRNPLVWVAMAATANMVRGADSSSVWVDERYLALVGYALVLPGLVIVLHLILSTLRSRSCRSEELLGVLPVGADRRSVGHALSALAAGLVGAVTTMAIYLVMRPESMLGRWDASEQSMINVPRPNLAQLMQGRAALVAIGVFVVAVVRWIPTWLVIVPLVCLTFVQSLFFGLFFGVPAGGLSWLWPLVAGSVHGELFGCETAAGCDLPVSGFDRITPWWHLAYLVALCVWLTTVAVVRHRRDRRAWAAFGCSLAVVVDLAVIQVMTSDTYTTVAGAV